MSSRTSCIIRRNPFFPIARRDPRNELFSPRCFRLGNAGSRAMKTCKRCSRGFFASHGNQTLCGGCRAGRRAVVRRGVTPTYGVRRCDRCWREYTAVADNQRYCSARCKSLMRQPEARRRYANPAHRGARARWAPVVAAGLVRCARSAACRRAELVEGQLVGGLILPTEPWHLGHPDGESVGGPEHVRCNVGAPSRLRAKLRQGP